MREIVVYRGPVHVRTLPLREQVPLQQVVDVPVLLFGALQVADVWLVLPVGTQQHGLSPDGQIAPARHDRLTPQSPCVLTGFDEQLQPNARLVPLQ